MPKLLDPGRSDAFKPPRDLGAAVEELHEISIDKNRKHLQRLAFTNLADRIDSMVDHALLYNATVEPLLSEALAKLTEPLPEGKLLNNDVAKLKSIYKAEPALTVKLSVGSIMTAGQFYHSVTYLLLKAANRLDVIG